MVQVPRPGRFDDGVEGGKSGRPAEFGADFFGAGDQNRRITGAARRLDKRDFAAGNALSGGDDLANAAADTVAEVVDAARRMIESLEDREVGDGEIVNVNVIADAGAVRSGVVGAKDG